METKEKIDHYRTLVKNILHEYAQYKPSHGDIDPIVISDEKLDHYQLLYLGWDKPYRVHSIIVHVRLHHGKIWVEFDGTEYGIANELVDKGVPKDEIVLAFHSYEKRRFTEFAVS